MYVCFRKNNFKEINKYIPELFICNIHWQMKSTGSCLLTYTPVFEI